MKNTFTLVLGLFLVFNCTAQVPYTPFDFENSLWKEFHNVLWFEQSEYEVFVEGDTIIDGSNFYKLRKIGMTYFYDDVWQSVITDSMEIDEYAGAIKENDQKQIELIYPWKEVPEVIYDFNWAVGDTLDLEIYNDGQTFLKTVIADIDSVEVCGQFRNRFRLIFIDYWTVAYVIEGIGGDGGLIPRYTYFESGARLYCYSNSECECGDLIVSTNAVNKPNTKFTAYPNPSNGDRININITSSEPHDLNLSIYNALGQKVYQDERNTTAFEVNCSNWQNGYYFIKVQTNEWEQTHKVLLTNN